MNSVLVSARRDFGTTLSANRNSGPRYASICSSRVSFACFASGRPPTSWSVSAANSARPGLARRGASKCARTVGRRLPRRATSSSNTCTRVLLDPASNTMSRRVSESAPRSVPTSTSAASAARQASAHTASFATNARDASGKRRPPLDFDFACRSCFCRPAVRLASVTYSAPPSSVDDTVRAKPPPGDAGATCVPPPPEPVRNIPRDPKCPEAAEGCRNIFGSPDVVGSRHALKTPRPVDLMRDYFRESDGIKFPSEAGLRCSS